MFDSEMWDNFVKEYADTKKRVRMIAEETFSLELTTKQVHSLLISDQVKWVSQARLF